MSAPRGHALGEQHACPGPRQSLHCRGQPTCRLERRTAGSTAGTHTLGWSRRSPCSVLAQGPCKHTALQLPTPRVGASSGLTHIATAPCTHAGFPLSRGFLFSTPPRDLGRHLPWRECAGILSCLPQQGLSLNGDASHSASKDQNSKAQLQTGERPVPPRHVCPGLRWLLCPGKQAGSAPATSYDSWREPGQLKPAIVRTVCFFEPVGVLGPSLRIQRAAGFGLSGGGGKWQRRQQHLPEPQPLLRDVAARA